MWNLCQKKEVTCSRLFVSPHAPLWITQRPSVFLAVFGTWGACWKPGQPTLMRLTQTLSLVFQSCLPTSLSLSLALKHKHTYSTHSITLSLSLFSSLYLSFSLFRSPYHAAVSPLVCGQHINGNIKGYKAWQNDTFTTLTWHFIVHSLILRSLSPPLCQYMSCLSH